ncbi:hypothetical protein D9619_013426 [Psilocybe cf. subviscida]|uniref:Uncharacterized protein n=1 Tax=Psilocybe cf. subviscida TaxID=2480587 RepID=A0A8H5BRG0_9AGAR|nr:hypothetical protein D9619_013426 [Psilocybe cf. subviscida]
MSRTIGEEAGKTLLSNLLTSDAVGDAYIREHRNNPVSRPLCGKLLRCRGDKLLKEGRYEDATRAFLQAAEIYTNTRLPTTHLYCEEYLELSRDSDWRADAYDVMACYTGAARALMNLKEYTQALLWLGEADQVSLNMRYSETRKRRLWDWTAFHTPLVADYLQHYYMHKTCAEVYEQLGNTGATVYHRVQAQTVIWNPTPDFMRTDAESRIHGDTGPWTGPGPGLWATC